MTSRKNARTCGWSDGRPPFYCVRKKRPAEAELGFIVCDFCRHYVKRRGLEKNSKGEKK
jgi:hypothetical protein